MYWIRHDHESQLRRRVLSVRFTDAEHAAICDKAWRERVSVSGMLREVILSEYGRIGVITPERATAPGKKEVSPKTDNSES